MGGGGQPCWGGGGGGWRGGLMHDNKQRRGHDSISPPDFVALDLKTPLRLRKNVPESRSNFPDQMVHLRPDWVDVVFTGRAGKIL